ncbi:rhomboid family protein [Ketogulonicigenium robustum]|uniref:Rhomboid family protein n=1 Tax=Ketogulonicigenium robustum TaxID=92947 RepID=A0A1W6NXM2_9RHOB|nr:rhomboid family intramembrane serine protease [Ketogulonicigenium robustum]ARO13995.1 rhomboid family protein [Ketogulonicigenium robustum]
MRQPSPFKPESAVNPLPPVVVALFLILLGVELALSLADVGLFGGQARASWRSQAMMEYGFFPPMLDYVMHGGFDPMVLKNFVTYAFVNVSTLGSVFSIVLLVALGKFVGEAFSQWALTAILLVSAIGGAVMFGIFAPDRAVLIGFYPAAYGLIGAYTYILWLSYAQGDMRRLQAFRLIGVLMLLQLAYGLIFGAHPAWIAELSGFIFGGLISVVVAPGGVQRLRRRLQQRR